MSYFDDASLVMIPSGYKTSKVYSVKPTDGSGDLTFSRSNDTASRVASNGLIERVRTNLITYSQAFDNAAWTKGGVGTYTSAITTGFTDPNGGTNAQRWLATIASVSDRAFVRQLATLTNGIPYTISFWVKSNTASSQDIYFMFQGGAVQATTATTSWQRISYSATTSTTSVLVGIEAKDLAIDVLVYGFQLEVGDVATDYIATTTAAVSVGPVANVPRLDYLNSSCPRLLLEPQRTNATLYSEQMDNTSSWAYSGGLTVSANQIASPDGNTSADKVIVGTNQFGELRGNVTSSVAGTYTASVFAKKGDLNFICLQYSDGVSFARKWFDLVNGIAGTQLASGWTIANSKIENYGSGWYRCSISVTTTATTNNRIVCFPVTADNTFGGANGQYIFAWGAQAEAGAYATSYIPTLGAAVTRGADAASKTGISSLIGQTEGTLFVDMEFEGYDNLAKWIAFLGTGSSYIGFYTNNVSRFVAEVANTTAQFLNSTFVFAVGQRYKLALAYKENDFAFYVNGTQVATDNSGTVPATSQFDFQYNTTANNLTARTYNQALLFKTRLTNAQLAELTTI